MEAKLEDLKNLCLVSVFWGQHSETNSLNPPHNRSAAPQPFTIASIHQTQIFLFLRTGCCDPMTLRISLTPAAFVFGTVLLASSALAQTHPATAPEHPTATDSPYGGSIIEEGIARVNNQIISRSDYDRALKEVDDEARQRGESMQQISARHNDLLRGLIDQQLWLSKGKELSITADTELIKKLDEIRKQYNLETLEDLEKAAKQQGVSFEDFKANIRNGLITQLVMRQEVGHRVQVTPGEVQQYFEEHKKDYIHPESVRLNEILIAVGAEPPAATALGGVPPTEDPAKLEVARLKAEDIEAKLKAGGDFTELARTYSDGPTAAQGGELGEFRRGTLAKQLEDQTFVLKQGEYTAPIHTKQGYIILKVSEHVPGGVPHFKDVESQVEEDIYMVRMEPAMRAYLTQMREEAYIDIKPGYVDSGASPKQTKPIYSSYTPPAAKKKKQVERVRFRESGRTFRQKSSAQFSAPSEAQSEASTSATPEAGSSASDTSAKPTVNKKASASRTEKAGKRVKVRYGQPPRETLPSAADATKTVDAGAMPGELANSPEPENPLEPKTVAPTQKTRYSARAVQAKKVKNATAKKASNAVAPPPEDATEIADRQVQAAPLGLAGDTASKKKKKKSTATTGEKTRLSDTNKKPAPTAVVPAQPPATQW